MAVVGIDDTDSRSGGMCTTWIGSEIVRRLPGDAEATAFLVRLHPAVEHKTRGNGAVAVEADVPVTNLFEIAAEIVEEHAVVDDPETNPGVVTAGDDDFGGTELRAFARRAVREACTRDGARNIFEQLGGEHRSWGNGRGLIGATAALGAVAAFRDERCEDPVFSDWTFEHIAYRLPDRWGTTRTVSVPESRPNGRAVWDTADPVTGEPVCVPHSPCPVLFGIRGDDPEAIRRVASTIESETIAHERLFVTNQGTDAHIRPGRIGALSDGHAYRVRATVADDPENRQGGHVAVPLRWMGASCTGMAFAPTGRFRENVRALEPGDEVIACGEASDGSIKLEKFALVRRRMTERRVPRCPTCERSMKSAGRNQGYRCRTCERSAPGKQRVALSRDLAIGWYEVPPDARRHLAKPLVRGSWVLPTFPTSG